MEGSSVFKVDKVLMPKVQSLDEWLIVHGRDLVWALALLFLGLLAASLLTMLLRRTLRQAKLSEGAIATTCRIFYFFFVVTAACASLYRLGFHLIAITRILVVIALGAGVVILLMRRYFPSLPFKEGDVLMLDDQLGKVEAISLVNTRIRTFDGKTIFIPNRKIINEKTINYYFTPNRQIRLELNITYGSDLLRAKAVLIEMMREDPRVLADPSPKVYVLNLTEHGVVLAARCWVKNKSFFITRCDLLEKFKLRFDHEGIRFACPRLILYRPGEETPGFNPGAQGSPGDA